MLIRCDHRKPTRKREEKVDIVDLSLSDSNLKQFQAAITDGTYGPSALWVGDLFLWENLGSVGY